MLRMSATLLNKPILSLRLGEPIGIAIEPIVNPHNLKIMGWWCRATDSPAELVLLSEDVREETPQGLAVNDVDALVMPEDLVRHKEVLEIHFQLMEKPVRTKRSKIGKITDYAYNDGMFVQKLYAERSLIKVFASEDMLVIDRSQILEVTDKFILVKDTEIHATDEELAGAAEPA
jgi:hypothetical protein